MKTNKISHDKCTGCMACVAVCFRDALSIKEEKDGFLYPKIDMQKCIGCKKCETVCPNGRINALKNSEYEIYGAYAKDRNISRKSRSGGLSFVFGRKFIEEGNVFYGAVIDENFVTGHKRCTTMEELAETQGSKYVQSFIDKNIYTQIKNDLNNNKKVLFSGTPCQCAAVKSFFHHENLYTMEILCHGVMSPKYVRGYIKAKEKRYGPLKEIDFREKKQHFWKNHYVGLTFENGEFLSTRDYVKVFYHHVLLRKSCYFCPYTTPNRVADLMLGDYWGVEKIDPKLFDKWGVSLLFVNSPKGQALFEENKDILVYKTAQLDKAAKGNPRIVSCMGYNRKRPLYVAILNVFGARWVNRFYGLEKKLGLAK